jgi:hypothetical protein
LFASAAGACVLAAAPAFGAFSDNFESSTPGSLPATTTSTSFSAQPGDWFVYAGSDTSQTLVTDAVTPGAAEGSNYFQITRPDGGNMAIAAAFEAWDTPQVGGTVTANWQMRVPTQGAGFPALIYLTSSLDNDNNSGLNTSSAALRISNSGQIEVITGNTSTFTPLVVPTYVVDTWQNWVLTADLTAQTATLAIDGVQSSSFGFNTSVNSANGLAFLGGGSDATVFVDDVQIVPEPSSMLLAGAGVGLIALRRRRADH